MAATAGFGVHRDDELDVGEFAHDDRDRAADRLHALALVFPPMRRQQNAAPAGARRGRFADARQRQPQRVDAGIAGDEDLAGIDALGAQIGGRALGRRKVPARQLAGHDAVELFRKRRLEVAGAQPGLDMGEGNAEIERGHRRHQQGRGVALRDDHVRPVLEDHLLERREQGAAEDRQTTRVRPDLDAVVGLDAEPGERLLRQRAVLAGTQRRHLRVPGQLQNDRRQLDRFGPRPNDAEKPHLTSRKTENAFLWHQSFALYRARATCRV